MASFAERIGAAVKALRGTPSFVEALSVFGGRYFAYPLSTMVDGAYVEMASSSYAHIYATQEQVRIVVDAIARNAQKRSMKCYDRLVDGGKEEDPTFVAAETMRTPNDFQSQRDVLDALVRDKLVYDDAYLWDFGVVEDQKRFLMRIPPHAVGVKSDNKMHPSGYRVTFIDGSWIDLRPGEIIHWKGYSADSNRIGVSPLETLRTLLLESATRKARMTELIKSGLVKGGIVNRPIEAPEWSSKAKERFQESFGSRLRDTSIGGVALLEDGMVFQEAGITPREAEILESKQFDLATIAALYGVNPGYFSTDGSLAQAREMMDEDVVAPLLGGLADTLTHQLIRGTYNDDTHFFRFRPPPITDIAKLFEAGSKATGGSTLTANEFREDFLDKPPIDGGDELVKNPGTQEGGTPPGPGSAPRGRPETPEEDVGTVEKEIQRALFKSQQVKIERAALQKAADSRRSLVAEEHAALFRRHFLRQAKQQEAGQWPALNQARWDKELAADVLALARKSVGDEASLVAGSLGGRFDMEMVENYLLVGARSFAKSVNNQTYADVAKAADPQEAAEIYRSAAAGRASVLGENRATQLMGFAATEAGKQLAF